MSFAKLFSSITESSLWSEPKEVRLLFVSMLARADATGFVEAAIPGLERLANLTPEEVSNSLTALEGPDPHSKNTANEGKRILKVPGGWMILNYEEYRNRRGEEERRDYMRDYMREYRRKQNVNSVNPSKPSLAQAEAEAEEEGGKGNGAPHRPLIPEKSGKTISGHDSIRLEKELSRVEKAIEKLRSDYQGELWPVSAKVEVKRLRKRREELIHLLGFAA